MNDSITQKSNMICDHFVFDVEYRQLRNGENLYDGCAEDEQIVMAEYAEASEKMDRGNIFIESLPLPRTNEDIENDFSSPIYSYDRKKIENMSISERLRNLSLIREQFRIALPFDDDLDEAVYNAFIKAYRNRKLCIDLQNIIRYDNSSIENPCPSRLYRNQLKNGTYGSFSMTGRGGTGKSSALGIVLSHYRQVVIHRLAGGGQIIQILYLIVNVPPNSAMHAFYMEFGRAVDTALGFTSPAYERLIEKCRSVNEMMSRVIDLIERFNIGLIILDEIQMFLTGNEKGRKIRARAESFQAVTTIMNTTGASLAVIGTQKAYDLIFSDQIHQMRRLGRSISSDGYCTSRMTFMRILRELFQYQWTDVITENITDEMLTAFMECTHGIIDVIISLYTAVQHEAIIKKRKSPINEKLVRQTAKKYFPSLLKAVKSLDEYEKTRSEETEKMKKSIDEDIQKQKESEISAGSADVSTSDKLIEEAVRNIMNVTDKFSYGHITKTARTVLKSGEYSLENSKDFVNDVFRCLDESRAKRSRPKINLSGDSLAQFLDNGQQSE